MATSKSSKSKKSSPKKSSKALTTYEEEFDLYPTSVGRVDRDLFEWYVRDFPDCFGDGSKNSSKSQSRKAANEPGIRTLPSSRKYESYDYVKEDEDEDDGDECIKYGDRDLFERYVRDIPDCFGDGSKNSSKSRSRKAANKPGTRTLRSSRKYESYDYVEEYKDEDDGDECIKYKSSYKKKLDLVKNDFYPDGSYYTYVLLDSRKVAHATDNAEAFADAIIYAGKGKDSRATHHIREAKKALREGGKIGNEKKINKIHDIWEDGGSVQVLKVAENISNEEALTREAFYIDTVGRKQLTNAIRSTYYGVASTMKAKEKQEVGIALLEEGRKILAKKGAERYYAD